MTKRFIGVGAMVLVFCTAAFQADAAFYLRPVAQFSSMATSSHADSDLTVGGGLAWGGVFGRDQRFEVGVEITQTRYKGNFEFPVSRSPSGVTEWNKVHSWCEVRPVLATFRYSFVVKNQKIRPYLGVGLGFTDVAIHNPSFFTETPGNNSQSTGLCWTGGMSGGVSYRLGSLTFLDFGYRYVFSDHPGNVWLGKFRYKFRYNAHIFAFAINQRIGRVRK